jgi:hypothetical protein
MEEEGVIAGEGVLVDALRWERSMGRQAEPSLQLSQ